LIEQCIPFSQDDAANDGTANNIAINVCQPFGGFILLLFCLYMSF